MKRRERIARYPVGKDCSIDIFVIGELTREGIANLLINLEHGLEIGVFDADKKIEDSK